MDELVRVFQEATHRLQSAVMATPGRINLLNETLSKADLEIQDLLHLIELENFNAAEGYYLAHQIKKALIKRRESKDELDILFDIKSIINQNLKFEPHVLGISKMINRNSKRTSQRTYKIRVRKDLATRFERVNKMKGID